MSLVEMCTYDSFIKLFLHYFEKAAAEKVDDLDGLKRIYNSLKIL